ncbi:MAG: TIGR00341 family protein [Alistipes sp.]|nr:TIGR00341 family protein [Alistipes sp.]
MGILKNIGTLFRSSVNLEGHIDTEAAERSIRNNIFFRGPNAWILAIAIIIASVGLNVNSIPVVIGAMLISPLMGPIFGLGLGLGISDVQLVKSSGRNLLVMVAISITASFLYFAITPLSLSNPTELLARTNPTIYDVLIALFGGFAGIFEQCRKEKGTVFAGVAIATALMPPLCTAGFGLAGGNFGYFFGAMYLFFINCLFIMLATYISVKYFEFRQTEFSDISTGRKTKRVITMLIILFIVPSIWSAVILINQNRFEENAIAFIEHSKSYGKSIIYDYKIDHNDGSTIELSFVGEPLDDSTKNNIYNTASRYGINKEQLIINDHTTTDSVNEIELVKDIYDRMDQEIDSREVEIARLRAELKKYESTAIPYTQLSREIASNYPTVQEVHIARGEGVAIDSIESSKHSTIVVLYTSESIDSDTHNKLESWLKIRLEEESIILLTIPVNAQPLDSNLQN